MPDPERTSDIYRGPPSRERVGRAASSSDDATGRKPATPVALTGRARDEQTEKGLLRQLDQRCSALIMAVSAAMSSADELTRGADEELARALVTANRTHERAVATAGTNGSQQVTEHRSKAQSNEAVLAPGPAHTPWSSLAVGVPEIPAAIKIGDFRLTAGSGTSEETRIPLLLPLLNRGNLVLSSLDAAGTKSASGCLLGSTVRLFASVLPGDLQCYWYDPLLRGVLAPLGGLREGLTPLLHTAMTNDRDLESCLDGLTADVIRVTQLLGGQHATLGDLEMLAGETGEPYRLLIVSDFPHGFSERAATTLQRLMERGPACGLSVVIHYDRSAPVPRDVVADDISSHAFSIVQRQDGWSVPLVPNLGVSLEPPPDASIAERVAREVAERAKTAAAPNVSLSDVVAATRLLAVAPAGERLVVGLGRAGLQLVSFTLGDNLDQTHNVLVGGAVGAGKSNVLLTMIHGLSAVYTPDELSFFLLDFKEGLEFDQLAPSSRAKGWLPHAQVLGLESDRLFGAAVLRHVREEFDRRATEFKAASASDLASFKRKNPDAKVPRWVIILDEFQVLLEGSDAITDEALGLLEVLARKGRAYGIHLVLASQTLSGITALITKEDSIFSQFPIRVALKTTSSESQVLLDRNNTEAAQLRYRGEAVLNRDSGAIQGNRRMTIAFAEPSYCQDLRESLSRDWPSNKPFVFVGSQPADPIQALKELPVSGGVTALLGRPVSVTQEPIAFTLDHEPGRHLILVGPGSAPGTGPANVSGMEALATLQMCCLSIAKSLGARPARYIMLDALSTEQRTAADLASLAMSLQLLGHEIDIVGLSEIPDTLQRLSDELDSPDAMASALPTFVIGWGMHRAAGLDTPDPISLDRPLDALHRIIKDGPVFKMHLVSWWNSYKSYEQHVESNYTIAGMTQGFVFLRASQPDVANVIGPFIEWRPAPNRLLAFDRAGSESGAVGVPFRLLSRFDLQRLGDQL